MLTVTLLVVGKMREKWMLGGVSEYQKRLSRFCQLEMIEIPDEPDQIPYDRALSVEADALLKRMPDRGVKILLDLEGKRPDSETFATELRKWVDRSGGQLTFIIGGSRGIDDRVRHAVDARWSLGAMTFPHTLTRILVLEQLFRGFKIDARETYHK